MERFSSSKKLYTHGDIRAVGSYVGYGVGAGVLSFFLYQCLTKRDKFRIIKEKDFRMMAIVSSMKSWNPVEWEI